MEGLHGDGHRQDTAVKQEGDPAFPDPAVNVTALVNSKQITGHFLFRANERSGVGMRMVRGQVGVGRHHSPRRAPDPTPHCLPP